MGNDSVRARIAMAGFYYRTCTITPSVSRRDWRAFRWAEDTVTWNGDFSCLSEVSSRDNKPPHHNTPAIYRTNLGCAM